MGTTPSPSAVLALCLLTLLQPNRAQQSSPQFLTAPSNITAYQNTLLPCTATGNPAPTISWYRNGMSLNVAQDSRLSIITAGLQVSGLQAGNGEQLEGVYQCEASNSAGSVRSLPATLTRTVWDIGFSSRETNFLTVDRFSYQALSCRMPQSSIPPAEVTWTGSQRNKNGVGVAEDGRLVISAYTPISQGSPELYQCTVTNPVSRQSFLSGDYTRLDMSGSLVIRAEVKIPPIAQQTVIAGETVILQCFTSGNPVPTISWSRGGVPVNSGGRVQLIQWARQLQITGVESSDAGTYTCSVTQDNIVQDTAAGVLSVIVPPRITSSFPEVSANVSQSFTVTCSSEGDAPLVWVWFKDATTITQSGRVTYTSTGSSSTLTVTDLEETDRGVYQCEVSQPATGRRDAHNQLIDVQVIPPMFLPPPNTYQDRLVLTGTSVTLPCVAIGFPTPTFQWQLNLGSNNLLPVNLNNARYSIPPAGTGNGSLTITSTAVSDSSTYVCQAMNSNNQSPVSDGNIILRVVNQPITSQTPPTSLTPNIGDNVMLPCAVTVDQGVTVMYHWTKNGAVLGASSRQSGTLQVPSVREGLADNGVYVCSVILTIDGQNSAPLVIEIGATILTVQGPPEPPAKPSTSPPTGISDTSFTAHWSAPTDTGRLPVVNYTLEVRARGSDFCHLNSEPWVDVATGLEPSTSSWTVRDVFPGIGYEYRVTVFTALFRNTSDPSAAFNTLTSAPVAPPSNVMVTSLSSGELRVTWSAPSSCLMWGGPLTGYSLSYTSQTTPTSTVTLTGNVISHTLMSLIAATEYSITVAARTEKGVGVDSEVVLATTMEVPTVGTLPPPPLKLVRDVSASNSTSVTLTWAPPTSPPSAVVNYTIKYVAQDGTEQTKMVPPTQLSLKVGGLSPGFAYTFRVQAVYENGMTSSSTNITVTLDEEDTSILSKPWFYAAVAGGGALFLVIATVLICCICCQCCKMGKYKVNVKRTTSGVSNASSNFTAYQRKNKKRDNVTPRDVTVHQSPTPSRRSADYAVPNILQNHTQREVQHQQIQNLQNQFPPPPSNNTLHPAGTDTLRSNISSTGPPSDANFSSSAMSSPEFNTRNADPYPTQNVQFAAVHPLQVRELANGFRSDMLRKAQGDYAMDDCDSMNDSSATTTQDEQSPYLDEHHMTHAEQLRRSSATATRTFQDTLQRVHTPPMSSIDSQTQFGSSYLAKTLSDDVHEPPWNAGECVNARGNMSGNMEHRQPSKQSSNVIAATDHDRNRVSHQSKSRHKGEHMMKQLSGPIPRSESLMSTESSNSLDYRGPLQLREDSHQLMVEGTRYQCPTPLTRRARPPQNVTQNIGDSYLTRADEIRMEELRKGHRGNGQWLGEEIDGYPSEHVHNRNWTQEEREHPFQGEVPTMISYGPQVHMSHSTTVRHGNSPPYEYDSDPPYAVPPSRQQQIQQQQMLSQTSIYQHPPPSYAAPPPPTEEDNISPPPPPLHTNSLKRGDPNMSTEQRLQVLPLGMPLVTPTPANSHTTGIRTEPLRTEPLRTEPLRTEPLNNHVRSKSNSTSKGSHFNNPVPQAKRAVSVPPSSVPVPPSSVPVPVQPPSVPVPAFSVPVPPPSVPAPQRSAGAPPPPQRSVSVPQHSIPPPQHTIPAPLPSISVQPPPAPVTVHSIPAPPVFTKGMQNNTHKPPSSSSLQNAVTPTNSTQQVPTSKSLTNSSVLESSSSSSISSNWSIEHMDKHFEKMVKGFDDLLSPLDEHAERTLHPTQEGSEGVDWDTPTGPHMTNGRGYPAPSKQHKPPVAQKPRALKKNPPAPITNEFSRGMKTSNYNSNGHGYSADEEDPAAMKKRVKVPDPSIRVDPRQPMLKVKKVQGSAWKPVPINRAIESSSEDSDDDSYCSDDTVIAKNDTMRSANV